MHTVGQYTITSSNPSKRQMGTIRVKNADGLIIAKISTERSQPYNYIRRNMCQERTEFIEQLQAAGVAEGDVRAILRIS